MKTIAFAFTCLLVFCYNHHAFGQSRVVRGSVSDISGRLVGASVQVKNTNRGVVTDSAGSFRINVSPGDTLVFSATGYAAQETVIDNRVEYDVQLAIDPQSLENVVVVGYGTRQRQFLTGAVSTVGAEALKSRPISNALSGLQGEIPGVVIQRTNGQPGVEGFNLNVRGYSSTGGGNSPLVLIDGVAGSLELLNPDDIESISVLKDAAAAIYGARAAGGVFIVTTKRGRKGTPRISYSGNVAVSKQTGLMKSPTNLEMAIMDNEANLHNGSVPIYTDEMLDKIRRNDPNPIPHPIYGGWMLFFTNTDWEDAVFTNGFQQKHNISVSGGGQNSTYYLSGSYVDQRGVIKYADDNNKRYNLRLNYDYDFNKWLRLEIKTALEEQRRTDMGGLGSWVVTEAIFGMPNHPVYTPEGKYFAQGGWGNAVAQAKEAATATFNTRNTNTNFKLIASVLDGLKINLQAGINHRNENYKDIAKPIPQYNWDGTLAYYTVANPTEGRLAQTSGVNMYKNFTGYVEYNQNIAGKHDIGIMAGASHEENDYEWFTASRQNFVTDDVWSLNLGTENMFSDGRGDQWALRSFFSRLSYVYNNKYLVEANMRYDGSSRFDPDNRWGFFPGISVGWRLSEENFMQNVRLFDDLKLRASYGETGNQEVVGLYDYLQLINIGGQYPFGAGGQIQSASLAGMVSSNRTWETLQNRNIGIDATLLNRKLSFSFDYFVKTNKNMLIPVTYPSVLGAIPPYSNSGELKTWGFETSINWKDDIGKLQYSVRALLSDAQNEVVDYGGADTYVPGLNWVREGFPLNTYFAYEFDGLIRTQAELDAYKQLDGVPSDIGIGDARFKDINGDGVISPYGNKPGDDGDVINVGSLTPRYTFGLNLGLKFKGFDFAAFFQGVGKRTVFREGDYAMPWSDWWRQPPQYYFGKTWNEDRPNAEYPRLSHGNIRYWNYQKSTLQKINGAYARLKNLQIGYTIPSRITNRYSISTLRVYFSGQDLWEVHGVKGGWDPESENWGFNYPFQRVYSFGVDLNF